MFQYISDSEGNTTGVFVPIDEWKKIVKNLPAELNELPEWQKEEVRKRIAKIENGKVKTRTWDEARETIFSK